MFCLAFFMELWLTSRLFRWYKYSALLLMKAIRLTWYTHLYLKSPITSCKKQCPTFTYVTQNVNSNRNYVPFKMLSIVRVVVSTQKWVGY